MILQGLMAYGGPTAKTGFRRFKTLVVGLGFTLSG